MTGLELDENKSTYQIRSYTPGAIKVNEQIFHRSLIITPSQLISTWPPQSIQELSYASLELILPLKPDVLLIGTGSTLIFPDISVYGELINLGIGVEVMNTSAACYTFNALTAENRRVVAALIIK